MADGSGFTLMIGDDYPLKGTLNNFEGYMFATTPKYTKQHRQLKIDGLSSLDGRIDVVFGDSEIVLSDLESLKIRRGSSFTFNPDLVIRRDLMKLFNRLGMDRHLGTPNPGRFSCVLIDMTDPSGRYDPAEVRESANILSGWLIEWCKANDRLGVVAQHLEQEDRCPHLHILYERARGKHNEFQDWLRAMIGQGGSRDDA